MVNVFWFDSYLMYVEYKGLRFQISDSKFQIPDFKFKIKGHVLLSTISRET